ncbi:MAG: J domain-containing protein [Luteibacter jiangsuensis]
MTDETDFIDLYGKLRVEPGCSLDEFKRAYRRNVALWHPDRRRGTRADKLAAARLQRLTAQYGAAMDFHRRHGRLPGAPLPARDAERVPHEPQAAAPPSPRPTQRVQARHWYAFTLAISAPLLVWSLWPANEVVETEVREVPARIAPKASVQAPVLALGMTQDEVLAIEGEPTRRGDERWEYGPSWVRFEADALVDWHSSPLRTLHVTTPEPRP